MIPKWRKFNTLVNYLMDKAYDHIMMLKAFIPRRPLPTNVTQNFYGFS